MCWSDPPLKVRDNTARLIAEHIAQKPRRRWSWWERWNWYECLPLLAGMYAVAVLVSVMCWAWLFGLLTDEMLRAGRGF